MRQFVCAVDVGTTSARAGLFDRTGQLIARAEHRIAMNRPALNFAEHDSNDIWQAVCHAVQAALLEASLAATDIAAIGFDATCSLVVVGDGGQQLSVSPGAEPRWDTIVWLDHRAVKEAEECTATGHRYLDYVGSVMPPEMQTPKLMWLKRHCPETWEKATHLFDLADFLTWKATGSEARSQCTLTCKWAYLAHENGWQQDFLDQIGLSDLRARGRLPEDASKVGQVIGTLTETAAAELGLDTEVVVGPGVIDAFAGAMGVMGGLSAEELETRSALIGGTSSCVMSFSKQPKATKGVWGPYCGVTFADLWLTEAGQSAAGGLLDHVIAQWDKSASGTIAQGAVTHGQVIKRIAELLQAEGDEFARGLHVLPDFHGNRSPFADAEARGVISGLALDPSFDGMCRLYWRTSVAIVLGVRQILDHLAAHDQPVETLHIAGGLTRNPLLMGIYTKALKCRVVTSTDLDAVLLGTSMAAATAAGWYSDLDQACSAMGRAEKAATYEADFTQEFDRDYQIFLKMRQHQTELRQMDAE